MRELDADLPTTVPPPGAARTGMVVVDAALVRAHQVALWRYLRVLGADTDEAADVAQEAFVVLLRAPVADRGPAALRVWLRTTARQLFLVACRRRRRSPVALDPAAVDRAWARYEAGDDGAGYRDALERCLELLPAAQRELVERHAARATSDRDARRPEAERSRLRRLKQALRDCVRRRIRDEA